MPHFDSRKCQKECNRWFKRQLANWTTADLLNIVVTWSKDDDQLIHPNYSDMPPRCYRQCVHKQILLLCEFLDTSNCGVNVQQWGVSNKHPCGSEGQRVEGGRGERRGTSFCWHLSLPQRHFAVCWPCSNAEAICGFSQQRPRKTRRVLWFDLSQS